ncbi:hypothetical protein [Nocardioides panaciterrulae]|uniref:Sulfotransferase family protein n=1 Tax=Nocardioides panaciterrulae TaxID=661492 RepID=A0A7Y9E4R2_9ACTN|nr:hypothetical protein [Nocardioides panaciterrulae]NYD40977.1 hypothetical protein [Nocardioides panaciterrulae]
MARRVFVHPGLPKTGTTYLQSLLWANRAALAEQDLLYPGRSPRQHMWASMVVREHPGVANRQPAVASSWSQLLAQLGDWAGTGLVSHEFFGAATAAQASAALAAIEAGGEVEVHLVVTARDVLTVATSYWQEYVKHGFAGADLDEFPPPTDPWDEWGWPAIDLEGVLRRWAPGLPPERVHVLVVPGSDAPREALLHEFAAILGVDATGFTTTRARENGSLGVVEVELLRRIGRELDGFTAAIDRGVWIRSYLSQGKLVPRRGERFLPSGERVAELRASAERAVAHVRDAGFTVHGDLERLLVPEELPELRHPASVTDAELLDAAVGTIAGLMTDVRRFRRENTELRKQEAARVAAAAREVAAARDGGLRGRLGDAVRRLRPPRP